MKKDRFYKICIVILLLINLGLLGFLINNTKHSHHPHRGRPHFKLDIILELDREQSEKFDILKREHREAILSLQDEERSLLKQYFESPTDSVLRRLEKIKGEKISITNTHFQDIHSILRPEQEDDFQDFKEKAQRMIIR